MNAFADSPSPDLKLVVVIPCLAETGILNTLQSLRNNQTFKSLAECWIIVNHAQTADPTIKKINAELVKQIRSASADLNRPNLRFYVWEAFDLPDKKAGVGQARKIGMDAAIGRLKQSGHYKDGVIICLDGDCTVSPNYLAEIENYFDITQSNGCSIHFEHPLDGENSQGIVEYELYLRYYNNALRWCGFPFAFQTVGSSMAVAATAYEKQGGMNTRKAGEDFYFLNKIIQLGRFGDLTKATVFPSPRKSDRVPFGTGREMMEWETTQQIMAYRPVLFHNLRTVFSLIDSFYGGGNVAEILISNKVETSVINYLNNQRISEAIAEAKQHTASPEAFRKRFFVWMNAFRIMKLLNELSLLTFPKENVLTCSQWLWGELTNTQPADNPKDLLIQFRVYDKLNAKRL